MPSLPQQRKAIKKHLRQHFTPGVANQIMRMVNDGVCRVTYERGVVKVHAAKDKKRIVQLVMEGIEYEPDDPPRETSAVPAVDDHGGTS